MSTTSSSLLLLPTFLFSPPTKPHHVLFYSPSKLSPTLFSTRSPQRTPIMVPCSSSTPDSDVDSSSIDCVGTGTGTDVECFASSDSDPLLQPSSFEITTNKEETENESSSKTILEWILLVSPFFFWGTAMVAMKEVLPKAGPFFVASFRLIPAGALLVGFAAAKGRKQPSGALAWLSIGLFAAVDAACFQVGRRDFLLRGCRGRRPDWEALSLTHSL